MSELSLRDQYIIAIRNGMLQARYCNNDADTKAVLIADRLLLAKSLKDQMNPQERTEEVRS